MQLCLPAGQNLWQTWKIEDASDVKNLAGSFKNVQAGPVRDEAQDIAGHERRLKILLKIIRKRREIGAVSRGLRALLLMLLMRWWLLCLLASRNDSQAMEMRVETTCTTVQHRHDVASSPAKYVRHGPKRWRRHESDDIIKQQSVQNLRFRSIRRPLALEQEFGKIRNTGMLQALHHGLKR